MIIFTIGFTKKSAEVFFTKLKEAGVKSLIDTRLNNVSQLAGFAKRDDLKFFLRSICDIDYQHNTLLAPTADLLDEYKKLTQDWSLYEKKFIQLMRSRKIEEQLKPKELDGACLLCSEEKPHHCHRRLVAEYLQSKWKNVRIEHIC
jgi:uncharacterized protein (DUF488 family)